MTDTMEAGNDVMKGFDIPEDARPKETIPYEVKSTNRREDSILALTVEVPFEEYAKRLSSTMKELKKTVVIPGFRKGKAPDAMLRRRFGKEIETDAVRDIAPTVFNDYVIKNDVKLAAEAQLEDFHAEEGKPLVIDFVAEVMPEVVLNEYKGLTVEAEYEEAEGSPVDRELDRMKQMFTESKVVEDGVVTDESPIKADIRVVDERGKTVNDQSAENYDVWSVGQAFPKELAEALSGKKAGDSVEVTMDRERKGAHGSVYSTKDTYFITVKEVKESVVPEITDEWIKEKLEIEGGLDEFKKQVEERAAKAAEEGKKAVAMGALLRTIHEKNPFDVPPTFVRRRFDQLANEELYRYSMMYGRKAAEGLMRNPQFQASIVERCKREVINAFLMLELAKKEGLEATDAAVDKEIERRAEEAGRKPLAIRAELERHNRLDEVKEQLLRDAVEEWLMANNTVEYVAPKPPAEEEHVHGPDCDHDHDHDAE